MAGHGERSNSVLSDPSENDPCAATVRRRRFRLVQKSVGEESADLGIDSTIRHRVGGRLDERNPENVAIADVEKLDLSKGTVDHV